MKNYSRQREELIKIINEHYDHPTAEDIYMELKGKDPAISRSTVYRNLDILVNEKQINKIPMRIGPDKFDPIRTIHNHAVCIKCGKVFDFNYDFKYDKIKKQVKQDTGIELLDSGFTLEGICIDCKNKN